MHIEGDVLGVQWIRDHINNERNGFSLWSLEQVTSGAAVEN
jgi:hypothetical protein